MSLDYLTDIIILLAAAVIMVPLSRLARLGIVPGFLIAGVVVGPSSLGLIDNQAEIGHLAELGVVLLLFIIGIELKSTLIRTQFDYGRWPVNLLFVFSGVWLLPAKNGDQGVRKCLAECRTFNPLS